jgi:glycosyltransferase involved in cell wall biosynthesis
VDIEEVMREQRDLSILIPARNEIFLGKTIEDILKRSRANTEVIAVLDGCDVHGQVVPIPDDPRVLLIDYPKSIGQRAATNQAAKLSTAKYIMKCDAHCAFDKGFDQKLMDDCEPDWTVIPSMYNLHGFDWECQKCGERTYQSRPIESCKKCHHDVHVRKVVWKPRRKRYTKYWRFDEHLVFKYWGAYKNRPESKGQIVDVMSSIGACWFMERERFWEIGGLDEQHGSWGQMGTEIACKSWLSGGRHVVNKRTWFAHMFRTSKGFKFPYKMRNSDVEKAREYSRDLWMNDKWPLAKRPLSWLIEKFDPPGWKTHKSKEEIIEKAPPIARPMTKGLVYYTDNSASERILQVVRQRLNVICKDWEIISVSQYPIDFGTNIPMPLKRSVKSLFAQVVTGLSHSTADVVFLVEHDVLYHPSHFAAHPPADDVFYYDHNRWCLDTETGKAVTYISDCPSYMCARRDLLLEHYSKALEMMNGHKSWTSKYGYSPPKGLPKEHRTGVAQNYMAECPTIDIRHDNSFTRKRMSKDKFRNESSCRGWKEAYEIPGWGETKDRFEEFLRECQISESHVTA